MAEKLFNMAAANELICLVDPGNNSEKGPFIGLESVYDAVDYLYTKKSLGKIVVELPDQPTSKL